MQHFHRRNCSDKSNVNKSYEIRTELMLEFQRSLREGFDLDCLVE